MTTFTTLSGNTFTTNEQGNYFYMTDTNGKKIHIKKSEFEAAQRENEIERQMEANKAQEELDEEPCRIESDVNKPAVLNEFGCVDCSECNVKHCVHRDCMRRNPRSEGGLAECPRLKVKAEEEEAKDPEIEQIEAEIPGIEDAEAELERNVRNEKKAKKAAKPRRSKDIAYEGHGITLTAKQVDFINHLPDTQFWEMGIHSVVWVDVLCDDIGGQFTDKPMTVGAMVSTLCEKKLGFRTRDTSRVGKPIAFSLTDLGKEVAKELGLN